MLNLNLDALNAFGRATRNQSRSLRNVTLMARWDAYRVSLANKATILPASR